ncbi:MAG: alanine racemase [Halanaerobium sp.]
MGYPILDIDIDKIEENIKKMNKICKKNGIELTAVVKGFAGDSEIFKAYQRAGINSIADSRLQNIKKYRELSYKGEAIMLRIPMVSEAEELVKYIDSSLISEISAAEALSRAAVKLNKKISLILMVDLGDRREGVLPSQLKETAAKIIKMEGVKLDGIGTNLGCFAGVLPDKENTKKLIMLKKELENEFDININRISAGNTATTVLLEEKELISEINNLRIGEGILLGTDIINERLFKDFNHYNFRLRAEIVELQQKPSSPEGDMAFGGQGRNQLIEDKGLRKRAVLAVGKQDIDYHGLYPADSGIEVLGASSDHLILDLSDLEKDLKVGDIITFKMNYSSMLRAMTSKYVEKNYIK